MKIVIDRMQGGHYQFFTLLPKIEETGYLTQNQQYRR